MMKKIFFTLLGITLLFGGCSIKSSPPIDEYTIVLQQNAYKHLQHTKKSCSDKSLKLLEPFGSYEYTTTDLHYVLLPNQENHYNLSVWSQSIAGTLYAEILNAISKSKIFGSVANYSSVAKNDYILEMEINDFKQYFSPDLKHSYVVADLTFTLIEAKRFKIVAQKEFIRKIETKSLDAKGGVEALNEVFNEIVPEVLTWLGGVCQ